MLRQMKRTINEVRNKQVCITNGLFLIFAESDKFMSSGLIIYLSQRTLIGIHRDDQKRSALAACVNKNVIYTSNAIYIKIA